MPVLHIAYLKPEKGQEKALTEAVEKLKKHTKKKYPGARFDHGKYDSPEGLNRDFTYVFVAAFGSKKERDAYLNDDVDHQRIAGEIVKLLEKSETEEKEGSFEAIIVDFAIKNEIASPADLNLFIEERLSGEGFTLEEVRAVIQRVQHVVTQLRGGKKEKYKRRSTKRFKFWEPKGSAFIPAAGQARVLENKLEDLRALEQEMAQAERKQEQELKT